MFHWIELNTKDDILCIETGANIYCWNLADNVFVIRFYYSEDLFFNKEFSTEAERDEAWNELKAKLIKE